MNVVPSDMELDRLAADLGDLLHRRHYRLATAESCTGGWVAKILTDIPGSSSWFERGFVTYSNEAKQDMLGVPPETIKQYGAVSEETAQAMAKGALENSRADFSLAISGIAGPGGGTMEKPVGTVWFAWTGGGQMETAMQVFPGDRNAIRRQAVKQSLKRLTYRLAS